MPAILKNRKADGYMRKSLLFYIFLMLIILVSILIIIAGEKSISHVISNGNGLDISTLLSNPQPSAYNR